MLLLSPSYILHLQIGLQFQSSNNLLKTCKSIASNDFVNNKLTFEKLKIKHLKMSNSSRPPTGPRNPGRTRRVRFEQTEAYHNAPSTSVQPLSYRLDTNVQARRAAMGIPNHAAVPAHTPSTPVALRATSQPFVPAPRPANQPTFQSQNVPQTVGQFQGILAASSQTFVPRPANQPIFPLQNVPQTVRQSPAVPVSGLSSEQPKQQLRPNPSFLSRQNDPQTVGHLKVSRWSGIFSQKPEQQSVPAPSNEEEKILQPIAGTGVPDPQPRPPKQPLQPLIATPPQPKRWLPTDREPTEEEERTLELRFGFRKDAAPVEQSYRYLCNKLIGVSKRLSTKFVGLPKVSSSTPVELVEAIADMLLEEREMWLKQMRESDKVEFRNTHLGMELGGLMKERAEEKAKMEREIEGLKKHIKQLRIKVCEYTNASDNTSPGTSADNSAENSRNNSTDETP